MTDEFTWTPDSGAKQTITAPVDQLMTDVGDGTYTYSFSVQIDGALTMIIKLIDASGVYAIWYPNQSYSEPNELINIKSDMYLSDRGINWVNLPYGNDYFTSTFYFTLKPPTTNTYTLSIYHDNGASAIIDGVTWFDSHLDGSTTGTETKTVTLTAGQSYKFVVNLYDTWGYADMLFTWSTPTMSNVAIPSNYFFYTK